MKKIIMLVALSMLMLGACSKEEVKEEGKKISYHDAYASIPDSDIAYAGSVFEPTINISNPTEMFESSSHIALVTLLSIDGGDNMSETSGEYVYPFTYGTMEINRVLKGDLKEDVIDYLRMGGIVLFEDYLKGQREASRNKLLLEYEGQELPKYINCLSIEDISIEVGKSYLVYLVKDDTASKKNHYTIIGWEGGLRELNIEPHSKPEIKEIEVYNNFTKSYENLSNLFQ